MAANVKRARRRDDDDGGTISDGRVDLPIFIHSSIDDFGLTPNAFRVYAHLVRRAGRNSAAWPSYKAIGETCFSEIYRRRGVEPNLGTLRRMAVAAINELLERGMIRKESRRDEKSSHQSNHYVLTPQTDWLPPPYANSISPYAIALPLCYSTTPYANSTTLMLIAPKGTPGEDTPVEGTPVKGDPAQDAPATFGNSTAGGVAADSATAAHEDLRTGSDDPCADSAYGDDGGGDETSSAGVVDDLARALSDVCGMAWELNVGRLRREAKRLSGAADPVPSADLVREHYGTGGWWWSGDWRGAKGDHPSPANIRETWGRWSKVGPAGNGRAADPLAAYDVPAGFEHIVKH